MHRLRFNVLGPVEVCDGPRSLELGGPRQVALLAFLLLHVNRAVSSDRIIDALWGSDAPSGALKRAQVAISRLRKALAASASSPDPPLRTVAGGYMLALSTGQLDADMFQALAEEGRRALDRGEARSASELLTRALALWRGPAYAEVSYEEFAQVEIRRLTELRLAALEARLDADLRLGRHAVLIGELEGEVAGHPTRERLVGQLMVALYRCERQADALDVYQRTRMRLATELGLEPGPPLKALQAQILEQSATLAQDVGEPSLHASGAPASFALPGALRERAYNHVVGRRADLERLWAFYEQADAGSSSIVLIRGEPGIGKTHLASAFARRAHAAGAVALYGRCDEEPLLPHQAFVEALSHYISACPLMELTIQLGRNSGELRRLVPEIAERLDLAEPLSGDPEGERYRLFDAVGALLFAAAHARPVVLVLDDLHWADRPTTLLLTHLARHAGEARLLIIGTYRPGELADGHPLNATLADLGREQRLERLTLAELDEPAVARLVRAHTSRESAELARTIFEETDGNPFFVVEMLRHLAESPTGDIGVPEGVKDVIRRRVARLGEQAQAVLSTASIVGRDFAFHDLLGVTGLNEEQLVEALEQALRAEIIEEVAGAAHRYTFSHALIRETIYATLTAPRRAVMHRRMATSIELTHAANLGPYSAELAHHFALGATTGDRQKAIEYAVLAGDHAIAQLAYEQAATHYRNAVGLITATDDLSQRRRCDLVIAQGEAERSAGDPTYRDTLLEGARLADGLADADRLARAALANNRGCFSAAAGVDRERVCVLEAALIAQGDRDSQTRASLLAHLAVELVADPDWPRRSRLTDDALAMARRVGDARTLLLALNYRFLAIWGPSTLSERLSNCHEANELAAGVEDGVPAFSAAMFGFQVALEAGEFALADLRAQRVRELAERLGQPIIHWYNAICRAARSSISDSPVEAENLARAAFDLGRGAGQFDAFAWYMIQLFVIRFLRGTLGVGRPNLLKAAQIGPLDDGIDPTGGHSVPLLVESINIVVLCEVGRTEDARGRFDRLMRDDLAELPHDWAAIGTVGLASVACAHLGDAKRAETLHALLEPHRDRYVDTGPSWFGATAHHMALLATTLGRSKEADDRFAESVRAYRRLDARPWLIRAQLDWAQALTTRGSDRCLEQAAELLAEAKPGAEALALVEIARRAEAR